jgi:hypothetical protein
MANKRMNLSGTGKEILDTLCEVLEIERPHGIKIAFAKGLSKATGKVGGGYNDIKPKWTIPDNIIRDKDYLLYKHLIINELQTSLSDDEVNEHMLRFIEYGLRIIDEEIKILATIEDYRIKVLN